MIIIVIRAEDINYEIDYINATIPTGRGPFNEYLKKKLNPLDCAWYMDLEDTPHHSLVVCPKWSLEAERLRL